MHSEIYLNSIDPTRNRYRAYAVTIASAGSCENAYLVRQSWGRGDYFKNQKTTYFELLEEAHAYTLLLLRRRARHGYRVTLMSECFPMQLLPEGMTIRNVPTRESLFQDGLAA